jgi:hypothetical protein
MPLDWRYYGMAPHILIAAALPALLGSLLLLDFAAVPRALLVQQGAVAVAAIVATLLAVRHSTASIASAKASWVLLGLAALVCVPIVSGTSSTPHRWLGFSGFRLYVAPVVLPLFLLLWHQALSGSKATVILSSVAVATAVLGLVVQPDAAQLTAFAIASVPVLWLSIDGRFVRLLTIAALLLAAAVSWNVPDPLAPVLYVEGVFLLAASYSIWVLLSAVLTAALPIIALVWLAHRMRSPGIFAVALYFAVLYLLAPVQVTPVPLLGFGASPILGYFIMASQARRSNANAA